MRHGDAVRAALDYDRLTERMYADADLTGDLLAVGLAIARLIRDGETTIKMSQISDWLGWHGWRKVRYTLADDRPRYVPPWGTVAAGLACEAPMIRRDGPCGRPSSSTTLFERDITAGTLRMIGHCARHREWARGFAAATQAAWRRNGCPEPAANTGGVLARYFACDWPTVYRWGDPAWTMPHGGAPAATPPRPALTLLLGDGDSDAPTTVDRRLAVVE